jgi:uncharacterized membrane protein YphA (DoxX/SURF4 family)
MLATLRKPQVDWAALVLRLGLAAIFMVHGAIKLAQQFPMREEMTMEVQTAVGWVELICGAALALGLFSRLAALAMIVTQVAAIVLITGKFALQGPLMERTGADFTRVGPEYNGVLIAMCLAVMLLGSGVLSMDHCLVRWMNRNKAGQGSQAGQMQEVGS